MALTNVVWNVGISLVQFLIGLIVSVFSVYLGIRVLDSLTKDLNEWKEIKKGNVAVGILVAAIVLSMAVVIESGVSAITFSVPEQATFLEFSLSLLAGFVNLLVGIVAAMVGIYFAITVFDQLTGHMDEFKELKKGNIAVAILLGAVILAVSFVIKGSVDTLIDTLNIAGLLGL